jgi:hypothetical protein
MNRNGLAVLSLASLLAVAVLAGCQGKGPDTFTLVEHYTEEWSKDPVPLDLAPSSFTGTYTLAGFTYEYFSLLGTRVDTKTEADFESYSGVMSVADTRVRMTMGATGRANIVQNWWILVPEQDVTFSYSGVSQFDSRNYAFADVVMDGIYYGDLPFTWGSGGITIDYGYAERPIIGSVLPAATAARALAAH